MKLNNLEAASYRTLIESLHEVNLQIDFLRRRGINCQLVETEDPRRYYIRATAAILPIHTMGTLPLEDEPSNTSDL